jgi:hypothetical protein
VQVNVVVRNSDVRGVLPKTNRSILKGVSRPDSVLIVALAKLLMDVGTVNSCDRVSGEGEVLHCIQQQFVDVAAAKRCLRKKLVVAGAKIERFGDGQRQSALNDDILNRDIVSRQGVTLAMELANARITGSARVNWPAATFTPVTWLIWAGNTSPLVYSYIAT